MRNSTPIWLAVIAAIAILCAWISLPSNPYFTLQPGLDIQGGLSVLLAPDAGKTVTTDQLDQARQVISQRVNGLGVSEPLVQISGNNRILVQIPGIRNPDAAISLIKQTGLLEFVDFSKTGACTSALPVAGQYILTDEQVRLGSAAAAVNPGATQAATSAATLGATAAGTSAATGTVTGASTQAATAALGPIVTNAATGIVTRAATINATATTTTTSTATATQAATQAVTQPATTVLTAAATQAATKAALLSGEAGSMAFKRAALPAQATVAATAVPTQPPTLAGTPVITQAAAIATAAATGTPAATIAKTTAATVAGTTAATAAVTTAVTAAVTASGSPTPVAGLTKSNPLPNPCTGQPFSTAMDGSGLQDASAAIGGSANNQWVVNFTIAGNAEGQKFGPFTASHTQEPMAIVLDGQVLSAPVIQQALTTGGQITGNFTQAAASNLALQLKYGALPVSLHIESQETIGASLGADSVAATTRAGILGVGIVLLFMIVSYRVPGFIAALALLLFALINFSLYKVLGVTVTLPALTGFLISIGTAVDGNILIFERLKEELRLGRTLDKAIDVGFARAWPSIRDSNISTIAIGIVLYYFGGTFGAGSVRGFAITLVLGLVTNLFTAVIVTRTFLNVALRLVGNALRTQKWTTGI